MSQNGRDNYPTALEKQTSNLQFSKQGHSALLTYIREGLPLSAGRNEGTSPNHPDEKIFYSKIALLIMQRKQNVSEGISSIHIQAACHIQPSSLHFNPQMAFSSCQNIYLINKDMKAILKDECMRYV